MTDFSRPNAQWSDLPSALGAFTPWRLVSSQAGTVLTLTLESGARRRMEAGIVKTGEEVTEAGTVVTWSIVQEVNGEVEAQIASHNGVVYITME